MLKEEREEEGDGYRLLEVYDHFLSHLARHLMASTTHCGTSVTASRERENTSSEVVELSFKNETVWP